MLDWLIMTKIMKNMQANRVLFHEKYLVNILLQIHEIKPVLTLDKPICAVFFIFSKYFMYDNQYNFATKKAWY